MSSSSEFSPFAAFLTVGGERPDASLLQSLPEEVLARARGFQSLKRQTEFLWGRLIFYAVFRALAPQAGLVERPPLTPQILMPDGSERIFASIAHTAGCIAVMGAPFCCALDAELMKPGRVNAQLTDRVFGQGASRLIAQDPVSGFYRLWGLREAAVKMQARFELCSRSPFARIRLENPCKPQAAAVGFRQFSGSSEVPTLVSLAAAEPCSLILLEADFAHGRLVLTKTGTVRLEAA